ncbi:phytanoyl-CoA dioxygenase family protein [Variovorax sp. NFACC27]|uniref:phytanoyl-CoA dioxygenase family protein n=1 Tax=unclassified Variovorax TaxID=663243 RepID=UPI0008947527|nr:Phytanoyl-CoA dioxygenase (PhyH) [Variovorax sp. NFACC28]SEG71622.1 Phytanoyl-CoA dioxygenase (PhyH) [Variovorax sp. NFACC29]SFC79984.1 Phytanoyl-CoA dioxygenase (PhyH) [Variovorax sp. NFACC26]SFF99506.1 Phytanoyl-CoA dioxygenase (PhyH) [Variovorax sp. NFACC27]
MTNADGQVALLEERGHALVPALLPHELLDATAQSLDHWLGQAAGSRNLLAHPSCSEMAIQLKARLSAMGLLDASSVAVQCTLFDKTADRNWLVALHQDTSIPASGAGMPCVIKEGEPYVQPPIDVLQSLLAVRVHLDDCGADAGPLRVVPGSHRAGRLDGDEAQALRAAHGETVCTAAHGDALLMRPLLLHASSRAKSPARRRVLHFLFGPASLPQGLVWNHVVAGEQPTPQEI